MIACPIFIVALFWLLGMCLYRLEFITVVIISISFYLFYFILFKFVLRNHDLIHKNDYFVLFLPLVLFFGFIRTNGDYYLTCEKMLQYEELYDNEIHEFEGIVTNLKKTKNGYEIYYENVFLLINNKKNVRNTELRSAAMPECVGVCSSGKKLKAPVIGKAYRFKGKIITQNGIYDYGKYDVKKAALSHKRYGYLSVTDYEEILADYEEVSTDYEEISDSLQRLKFKDSYYDNFEIQGESLNISGFRKSLIRIKQILYEFKETISAKIDILYSDKSKGIIKALLIGDKTDIESDVTEDFSGAGISHILAISGLHITVIIAGFYELLRKMWFGKPLSFLLSGLLCILFSLMTGCSPSTVRASIMICIHLFGKVIGREVDLLNSLSLAFIIMTFLNPLIFLDSSFILSFICIFFVSVASKSLIPLGIALQNMMFFVTSWFFFEIPTYQFIINIPVLAVIPIILILGIASITLEALINGAGQIIAFGNEILIKIVVKLAEAFNEIPYSRILTGRKNKFLTIIGIVIGIIIIRATSYKDEYDVYESSIKTKVKSFFLKLRKNKTKNSICIIIFFLLPLLLLIRENNDGAYFINVGQGNCTVFLKGGNAFIIDCGSSSEKDVYSYTVKPFLKYNGIDKIEVMALTHSDADHINGAEKILMEMDGKKYYSGRIAVEKLLLPLCEKQDRTFVDMEMVAMNKGVEVEKINSRTQSDFTFHDMKVEILYPFQIIKSSNETSLSFLISDEKMEYLILGDLGINEEKKVASILENKYETAKNNKSKAGYLSDKKSSEKTQPEKIQSDITQSDKKLSDNKLSDKKLSDKKLSDKEQSDEEKIYNESEKIYNDKNKNSKLRVINVAHHGSQGSTSEELLETFKPDYAIISCSRYNTYGHPSKKVLDRLSNKFIKIWLTFEQGTMKF